MAELATIARPYANAVFALAKQDGTLEQWSRMLQVLEGAMQHENTQVLLVSPDMPASAKAFRLADICGSELDDRGKTFLQALADHDRLTLVPDIRVLFEELRADEERSLEVEVVSAFELSDSQADALKQALYSRFEKEISIEARVDKSLIGGAIVRAGDMVIDGSIRGKLNKLAETLVQI